MEYKKEYIRPMSSQIHSSQFKNYKYGNASIGKIRKGFTISEQLKHKASNTVYDNNLLKIETETEQVNLEINLAKNKMPICNNNNKVKQKRSDYFGFADPFGQKMLLKRKNSVQPRVKKQNESFEEERLESEVFNQIFYKKVNLRTYLGKLNFLKNSAPLHPNDEKVLAIYKILQYIFSELEFYMFNLLINYQKEIQCYYIYFSDCDKIPFSKCCNAPIQIQIWEFQSGKLVCQGKNCKNPELNEFIINFDDREKLQNEQIVFKNAKKKNSYMRQNVSKLINNGQFKHLHLYKEIAKQNDYLKEKLLIQDNKMLNNIDTPAQPFLTQQFPELFEKKKSFPQNFIYKFPSKNQQRPATSNAVSRKYNMNSNMTNPIFRIKNYLFQQQNLQNELCSTQKQMTQQMRIKSAAPKLRQFQYQNQVLFDQNDQDQSFQDFQKMMKEMNVNNGKEETNQ